MRKFLFLVLGLLFLVPVASFAISSDLFGEQLSPQEAEIFQDLGVAQINDNYYLTGPFAEKKVSPVIASTSEIFVTPNPWTQIGTYGFGDTNNMIVFPSTVYKKYLYFRTLNTGGTGAQLYRIKGKGQPEMVGNPGFGNVNNLIIESMKEIGDYLYITMDGDPAGGQMWRTKGTNFTQIGSNGFGDANNETPTFIGRINGHEYLSFWNDITGVEIWRSPDGVSWTQVNTNGFGTPNNINREDALVKFGDYYYLSVRNNVTGCEVWRTQNGKNWEQAASGGFGSLFHSACNLTVFNDDLLATFADDVDGFGIYKTKNGTSWQSASPAGLGDNENHWGNLEVSNGWLYVGTYHDTGPGQLWKTNDLSNWSQIYPTIPMSINDRVMATMNINGNLFALGINIVNGARIWYYDGTNWSRWNTNGMDGNLNNSNIWLSSYRKYLMVTSLNPIDGAGNWRQNFSGGVINNLEAYKSTKTYVNLKWRAPKGKNLKKYIVKRYSEPITEDNWHLAKTVKKINKIKKPGKTEKVRLETKRKRTYYFAVITKNGKGIKSSISNVVPSIRKLQTKKITTNTARLKYSGVDDTEKYIVQLRTESGEKIVTWKNITKKYRNIKKKFMESGTAYKWRVRSVDWEGNKSDWSRYKQFTTK